MISQEITNKRYEIELEENWTNFYDAMEYIELEQGFSFRVVPPIGGALMRFLIFHKESERDFSVYFDAHDQLGSVGQPYFEVYPVQGDTFRSTDIKEIMKAIYIETKDTKIKEKYPEWFL